MNKSINLLTLETKEKITDVLNESGLPLVLLDYLIKDLSAYLTNALNNEMIKEKTAQQNKCQSEKKDGGENGN